jgi:hypothetical protein
MLKLIVLSKDFVKFPVSHQNSVHFISPEGSLPCSQQPTATLYSESDISSPHTDINFNTNFSIILYSTTYSYYVSITQFSCLMAVLKFERLTPRTAAQTSSDANAVLLVQGTDRYLWYSKFHRRVHNSPLPVLIPIHTTPAGCTSQPFFTTTHSDNFQHKRHSPE